MKVLKATGFTGMPLVPDVLVIPGSSGSLQMVDHTLIDIGKCLFGFPILRTLQGDVCELPCLPCDY